MSLKEEVGMLEIDHQHGRFGNDEPGTGPRISVGKRRDTVCRRASRRSIRMDGANAGAASLHDSAPAGEGAVAPVCSPDDRLEPGPADTADCWIRGEWPGKSSSVSAEQVRQPLSAGGGG